MCFLVLYFVVFLVIFSVQILHVDKIYFPAFTCSTLSPLFTLIFPLWHCNNMVLSFTGEQLIASGPLICRDYWHCWRIRNGNKLGVKAKVWEQRLNSTFVWGHGEYKVARKQNKLDILHQTGFNGDVTNEVECAFYTYSAPWLERSDHNLTHPVI